jgi:hypothetical protein
MEELSRRKFLLASGVAATGAAVAATPQLVSGGGRPGNGEVSGPPPKVVQPAGPGPREPVMAYVRDARSGHVTVMSGTQETTYRDPALVKRLLAANSELQAGGDANVIAP